MKRAFVLVAAVSLAAVLQAGAGVVAPAARTHTVLIAEMKFHPETLTVGKGDTVVWVNKDFFPHTATASRGFDSQEIGTNKSWRYVARQQGTFPYVCTLHPSMKGTLIVK